MLESRSAKAATFGACSFLSRCGLASHPHGVNDRGGFLLNVASARLKLFLASSRARFSQEIALIGERGV
jgi:hypothetical protein